MTLLHRIWCKLLHRRWHVDGEIDTGYECDCLRCGRTWIEKRND